MDDTNTNNDDFYYEYNDERSIYQPSLFDFETDIDIDTEVIQAGEPDEKYLITAKNDI